MEIPEGLELRDSPIHGLGVFATRDFPTGYCFGEFIGTEMGHTQFKSKYGNDRRYCCRQRRTWRYRVAKENRNWITYVNDGKHNQSVSVVNVYIKRFFIYAQTPVKAGDELLLDYGKEYPWNDHVLSR